MINYRTACFISAALLILALADLPYGFYTFLRIVVCGTAAFGAFAAYTTDRGAWVVVLGLLALLFNPIFPIYLDREAWAFIDIITAAALVFSAYQIPPHETSGDNSG
jgi:hypothetical protein